MGELTLSSNSQKKDLNDKYYELNHKQSSFNFKD